MQVLHWNGDTTAMCSDQAYLDAFGRAHIVELKREEAKPKALAQVLAYAELYRTPPHSETIRRQTPLPVPGQ